MIILKVKNAVGIKGLGIGLIGHKKPEAIMISNTENSPINLDAIYTSDENVKEAIKIISG